MVNPTVSRIVQHGLVLLEIEIENQQLHGWGSAEQLIIRIQNVMEGIGTTIETGQYVGSLSESDRNSLWSFHHYLYKFTEIKELTLNEEEKDNFISLGVKLRENGWGRNIGFSSDWDDFMDRTNNFLSNSK